MLFTIVPWTEAILFFGGGDYLPTNRMQSHGQTPISLLADACVGNGRNEEVALSPADCLV